MTFYRNPFLLTQVATTITMCMPGQYSLRDSCNATVTEPSADVRRMYSTGTSGRTNIAARGFSRFYKTLSIPQGQKDTLLWFIDMRYKIGVILLSMLLVSYVVGITTAEFTLNLGLLTGLYLVTSGVYSFLLRGDPSERRIALVCNLQLPDTLTICTLAIYFAGGALTPMVILYPLAILEAIILVEPRAVYRTGAAAVALYCALSATEAFRALPHVNGYWGSQDYYYSATPGTYVLYTIVVCCILVVTSFVGNRISLVMRERNIQVKNQLRDLTTLYNVANGLGSTLDEDEMLSYLADTLKSLQDASMCIIGVIANDGSLEIKASAGVPSELAPKLRNINKTVPELGAILLKGQPIIVEDLDSHPEGSVLKLNSTTRSAYIYPIKLEGKVLGAVSLSFDRHKVLTPEYDHLMTTIVSQAGIALQRVRLFCDTQRLAHEMSMLYDVGLYTGSTLSKDEVVRRTCSTLERLMNPDSYYIALYNAETEIISFEKFVECRQEMPRMRMSLSKGGLTGRIISCGEPVLVGDWLEDGEEYNAVARKTGTDMLSYLGVPMILENEVVGVISVQSEKPLQFDKHHERLLIALAAQTAMALENARLHHVAQNQAKYDSLTKVYNHGHFVELVRKAVEESDRNDTQVSLIMLDIDHFKQYNDTFGHMAGDNVLRMVANALKSSVRESTDAVGRWGGEEFAVLLAGVGVTEAKKVSRYIRRAVAELYPVNAQGQVIPNPTISQGISSYPYPSLTPSSLIDDADTALYHAKKRGRNQLVVHDGSGGLKEATHTTGHLSLAHIGKENELNNTTGNLSRVNLTTGNLTRVSIVTESGLN